MPGTRSTPWRLAASSTPLLSWAYRSFLCSATSAAAPWMPPCRLWPDPARVGAGQIGPGDQRLGPARQALVGRDGSVAPFRGPAFGRGKPRPRHANRHGAERAHQGPLPMTVAMARHRRLRLFAAPGFRRAAARVALARQRRLEFRLQKLFDEGPDARAHSGLQWIKPVLAEKKLRLGRTRDLRCGICRHGVISAGAPTPVMVC